MKDLELIIKATHAISPSRNIVSQILFQLPQESRILYYSYPELLDDKFKKILEILGVKFNSDVNYSRSKDNMAHVFVTFIHKNFDLLNIEENRFIISKLTSMPLNKIPDLKREWLKLTLRKIMEILDEELSQKFLKFLKMLTEKREFIVRSVRHRTGIPRLEWNVFLDEVIRELNIDKITLNKILDFIFRNIETISRHTEFSGDYIISRSEHLYHGFLHLDIIMESIYEDRWRGYTNRYSKSYYVRNPSFLKEVIGEVEDETK